jgi:hypothetical protein
LIEEPGESTVPGFLLWPTTFPALALAPLRRATVPGLQSAAHSDRFAFPSFEGGGFSVVNVDSHTEVLELMANYPLFGMVVRDVKPVLTFREGTDAVRAKLVEAQAAMGNR